MTPGKAQATLGYKALSRDLILKLFDHVDIPGKGEKYVGALQPQFVQAESTGGSTFKLIKTTTPKKAQSVIGYKVLSRDLILKLIEKGKNTSAPYNLNLFKPSPRVAVR